MEVSPFVVSLRPFREEEYPAWNEAHRVEYERGLVEFAGLSREAARAKVAHDVPSVLPDGLSTVDTCFWVIEDDGLREALSSSESAATRPGSTTS